MARLVEIQNCRECVNRTYMSVHRTYAYCWKINSKITISNSADGFPPECPLPDTDVKIERKKKIEEILKNETDV